MVLTCGKWDWLEVILDAVRNRVAPYIKQILTKKFHLCSTSVPTAKNYVRTSTQLLVVLLITKKRK